MLAVLAEDDLIRARTNLVRSGERCLLATDGKSIAIRILHR